LAVRGPKTCFGVKTERGLAVKYYLIAKLLIFKHRWQNICF